MTSATMGCYQRIAWLLTTSRVLGPDPELARRDGFIRALGTHGVQVDNSRVSRWESGLQPLPGRVVATYESVLGLTQGSLVAVAAGLRRAFDTTPHRHESALREPDLPDYALDKMLDRAERREANGGHWMRLAEQLNRFDRVFLRQEEWARLSDRLVTELATSTGVGYVRRYEAAASLIRHPNSQRPMTRAIGNFVMHPDAQVVAPILNLLTEVTDSAAGDLILRMMDAENNNLRRAASSVAAFKVARGHFGKGALPVLESHVVGALRRGESLDGRLDSFDLAVHLPDESWARVSGGLRTRRAFGLVTQARSGRELVPAANTARMVVNLSTAAQADTPAQHSKEPDLMLRRLLREALLHAHKPRRHHAALLIAASPYAPAVSHQCLRLSSHHNDLLAARAWTVLMRVGQGGHPDRVVQRALLEERPTIRARALVNVGLSVGSLGVTEARTLADLVNESARPMDRQATMFALGMKGADELKELAEHPSEPIRNSASWWIETGPAVHDSDVVGNSTP